MPAIVCSVQPQSIPEAREVLHQHVVAVNARTPQGLPGRFALLKVIKVSSGLFWYLLHNIKAMLLTLASRVLLVLLTL